ncbi:replication initiator protein WhiP [Caldisphaera sp.]|uniref:replication initiator protein WhiP n=1 Tax=Caldisphaera sp. TaxID=2060322 RepID=UPI0025B97346|nr:replication initiator protein WhiP [Caldisphaera sp.]
MNNDRIDDLINQIKNNEKGGPRSRLVDAILILLISRPMRSNEIAQYLNKETKYISSYLSYWKERGFVEYDMGLWYLTPKGEDFAREIISKTSDEKFNEFVALAQKVAGELVKKTINDKSNISEKGKTKESLSFIASKTNLADNKRQNRVSQVACVLQQLKDSIDEEEMEITSFLLTHYAKYGVTYVYLDQITERLNADYNWLLKRLRNLQSKGILYIYTDPRLGIRVGLTRNLKDMLKNC